MASKIPPDAFECYVAMGAKRSYESVAQKYGVSKRSVVKRATREGWQRRVAEIETRAQERATERAVDTLEEVKTRHLKAFKAVQLRALESLKALLFKDPMDAVRAMDIAARHELLALGEPSERTAVAVEDVIRREYERWMVSDAQSKTKESAEVEDEAQRSLDAPE